MDTFDKVCVVVMVVFLFAGIVLSHYRQQKQIDDLTSPKSELQEEVERLRFYKDLFDNGEVTLCYNGCTYVLEELGLGKEEVPE
ncbi:MAG: hypothetical protein KAR06_04180 [Deltaproteobacteria bacterium]|nr:hypothetical protein [Deltaproteobacteria bacterium]